MNYYSYVEPSDEDVPIIFTIREDLILEEYWPYWEEKMLAKYGRGHSLITKENCLEDWIAVHWAWQEEI